jgi:hypothetical protein
MSFYPFENPVGFGIQDFLALSIAIVLIAAALLWRTRFSELFAKFAERTGWSMLALAALSVILRIALLPHHPVPTPDIYDEFGHLLVADTLLHFRLSNPPHAFPRFFETFFVLQEPTYSSIYPIGQGLALAFGKAIFGQPWAGVVLSTAAFCSLSYWMLRGWVSPLWAFAGGLIAVFEFGPLCYWMNSYWGGALAAASGCLVFGALPRLRRKSAVRHALILGSGLAMLILIRPYESLFVFAAAFVYLLPHWRQTLLVWSLPPLAVAGMVMLLQNKSVTGQWTTLPYQLSQYQYGVPASLTIQSDPIPHRQLTAEQKKEYDSQIAFRGGQPETLRSFLLRLEYRARFYRFFLLPPLYVGLAFFLPGLREPRFAWLAGTVLIFSLGNNLFPAFQLHYLAPVACVLIAMPIIGLERLRIPNGGAQAAQIIFLLCCFHFALWYSMHLFDDREFSQDTRQYETWSGVNHRNPERRIAVNKQLEAIPGKILVFVRYSPGHVFQDEWVYNQADIDSARIVWARDLGLEENTELQAYYKDRSVYLLEPDFRPPRLRPY